MTAGQIQRIKKQVRSRDGMRCTECGMTNGQHVERFGFSLDVHRIVPGSPYTMDGCRTVCRPCHGLLPKRAKGQGDTVGWVIRVRAEHHAVMKRLARKNRRTLLAEVMIALDRHIVDEGFTPPLDTPIPPCP